ncbi:JmjC domain-containing protein [Dokdonella sp.]|uniref:JmjC domain-containing protein n=1 Tax=Dokdonella sp. TaxID=2291710 RepID=UPI0039C88B49
MKTPRRAATRTPPRTHGTAAAPPIEIDARRLPPLGMPAARFLADHWQQRPLLIRNAFADFRSPITPEDLAGLACEELALSRLVMHERRRDRWTLRSGPFEETDFTSLPAADWTLLVQDVDKWDADVAALLGHFDFLPSWRVDDVMVSYAADRGSVGAHVDQYDVFLLQGIGRRRWQISTDPAASLAFRDDTELKLLQRFEPTHEWLLEPGDMLYLPPGVPHHGVAEGPCLTLSIGMRAPSRAELIVDHAEFVAERLAEADRYRDAGMAPARRPGEIDPATIERLAGLLGGAATSGPDGIAAWFVGFITRYRSAQWVAPRPRPLDDAAFERHLVRGDALLRNPWSRCAWVADGRQTLLGIAGSTQRCSRALAQRLCAQAELGAAEVQPLKPADRAVVLALVNAGHYALVGRRTRSRR